MPFSASGDAAVKVPTAKISDFHLSKEESGQLITKDDSTKSNTFDSCGLKGVSTLSLWHNFGVSIFLS